MSFLLKSALCLTIVFSCMEWPQGERPQAVAQAVVRDVSRRAQQAALEKATSVCTKAPLDCLAATERAAVVQKTSLARAQARRDN